MHVVRLFFGALLICSTTLVGVGTAKGQLLDGLRPDYLRLDAREIGWIDPRYSPAELAMLDSTRGFAPPAFPESAEFIGSDPIKWDDLRGRVVVALSWTAANSEGRALPRRVERILQEFDPNDVLGLFVHTPDGAGEAASFAERLRLTQPVVVDHRGEFLDEMGIFRQPVISIVDRSGKVRYAGVALVHLEEAVRHLVRERFDAEAPAPKAMTPRAQRTVVVAGSDTTGGRSQATFPHTDSNARIDGEDLRGQPLKLPAGEGIQVIRPVGPGGADGQRVIMTIHFKQSNLTSENVAQFNRWAVRMADTLLIIGVIETPVREATAWANSNSILFPLMADPESTLTKATRLTDRDLPYCYIASPDGVIRWQGGGRRISESLLNQIISASGLDRERGDAKLDPMALPRWRDTVR